MPAILTHDFFGRDACKVADGAVDLAAPGARDAFLLGNQGPDPLFYLVIDSHVDASMRVGPLMHHERPSHLLAALHDAVALLPERSQPVGRAYAAGFVCHYLLDSSVHPLVFATQHALSDAGVSGLDRSDGSRIHAEIERDLDEMVLFAKTGQTIADYRPYAHVLAASPEVLDVIDRLYFYLCLWTYGIVLDATLYTRAVRAFRLAQRLFWAPSATWRETLGLIERTLSGRRYSLFCAMAHRPRAERGSAFDNHERAAWTDPFTGVVSTASFWDLYFGALTRVRDAIKTLCDPQAGIAETSALTGGLNFSGNPVDEDAPVGSVVSE